MTEQAVKTFTDFVLPSSVVTKVDVSHLVSEVERIDDALTAAAVRAGVGATQDVAPVVSQQLTDFLAQNTLSLLVAKDRTELIKQLRLLKEKVPVIHMTFAVTADPESLQEIAAWVRTEVSPQAVIAVGLQPSLVAGVYLRTPNHVQDLSLRGRLAEQRDVLAKELGALRGNR